MTTDLAHRLICISLLLAAMNVSAQQRVYKWVDANGVVHYSDAPPDDAQQIAAETLTVPSSASQVVSQSARNAPGASTRVVEANTPPEVQASAPALAPAQVQRPDCSSPSPRKRSGQDLYSKDGGEPPEPLTAEEIESFETVIKGMAYRWSGTDVGFACDGAARRPPSQAVVSEGRTGGPSELVLESTVSSRGTHRLERLHIELRDQRLWVNQGYASLISVSDRILAFGYREHVGGGVRELFWRIELDGRRAMKVEQVIYANGALNESSTWETRKPF